MADERFLVVRLGSLGDIVHTFPAVAGLRESFPKSAIVWLTHPRWMELVASSGLATPPWGVPRVLLLPPLMCRFPPPSRQRFEGAVDLRV